MPSGRPRAVRLRDLSRLPHPARSQLHSTVALGTVPGLPFTGEVHFCMRPQPWPRTGPGSAKDGKPKFNLSAFDQNYFDRLRERVVAAGSAGIYASVML